jgi:hypothetical protein
MGSPLQAIFLIHSIYVGSNFCGAQVPSSDLLKLFNLGGIYFLRSTATKYHAASVSYTLWPGPKEFKRD